MTIDGEKSKAMVDQSATVSKKRLLNTSGSISEFEMKDIGRATAIRTPWIYACFEEKMSELSATLYEQFAESDRLEAVIKRNLEILGYGR